MKKVILGVGLSILALVLLYLSLQLGYSRLWSPKLSFPGAGKKFTYREIPPVVEAKRKELLRLPEPERSRAVGEFWTEFMDRVIFPAWKGTLCGFYGTAERPYPGFLLTNPWVPRSRKMACGVFVGTVLRDMGFVINRLRLGQLASGDIVRVLVSDPRLRAWFSNISVKEFSREITRRGKGIYVLGLDHHVGFILYNKGGIYIIHSSGRFPFCVVKERIRFSRSVLFSRVKAIGKLSEDRSLIHKWLFRQRVY